jgi:hypothetical protein
MSVGHDDGGEILSDEWAAALKGSEDQTFYVLRLSMISATACRWYLGGVGFYY